MITKYYGVFCAHCRQFMEINSYQVERPEQIAVTFIFIRDEPVELPCPKCGLKCAYKKEDVAHSTSQDGSEPQYPERR